MKRFLALDGVRGIAILLVLGCHYVGFSGLLWGVPRFGWIGVELFFCLSGYLITTILLKTGKAEDRYRTFYARRFIRILPPYLVVLAILSVIGMHQHWFGKTWLVLQLLFLQAERNSEAYTVAHTFHHFRWYLQHLPSLLTNAHALPVVQAGAYLKYHDVQYVYWSLSVEEYFYLLWAPVVLNLQRRALVLVGLGICVVEFFLRWSLNSDQGYYQLGYRFDALMYGAFLAVLLDHWRRSGTPAWAQSLLKSLMIFATVGLFAIWLAIAPVLNRDPRFSPLFMSVGLPLLSLWMSSLIGLLVTRAGTRWWLDEVLSVRPLRFIGTISYAMYLWHMIAATFVHKMSGGKNALQQSFAEAVLSTALTIVLAYTSWRLVEGPALRWKDRHFPNAPHPPEPDAVEPAEAKPRAAVPVIS